ncbi:MAG: S-layer homology domain-containing protein [Clostridiales bacterium]|nr:S-layer homology domain-containing protein [Clostridiales bacterium]
MRQFLKKRVPTFLLTLVMVMTMVPAVSAKSSDITYSVKPGDSATFSVSDFSDYYDKYCSGTFEHVEFSVSRSDYSDFEGSVAYRGDTLSRADLVGSKFYDTSSDFDPDSDSYPLKRLSLVADSSASTSTLEISFTAYGTRSNGRTDSVDGTLSLEVSKSGSTSSKGDIVYEVKAGDEVSFSGRDFEKYFDKYCDGTFRYVEFDRPNSSDYADGYIYFRHGKTREDYFTRTQLSGTKFYYSDSDYGDYDLDELSFVADKSFSGPITLSFTVYGGSGTKTNRSETGTLVINASGKSTSYKGDISYTVKASEEVAFDEDDFQKIYDKSSCTGTFKYVAFDRPSTSDYAKGTLYSKYGARKEVAFTRSDISGTTFGYSSYDGDVNYNLSDLSFVADKTFTSGSITLTFTLYGGSGSRTNQSTTGTLVITTNSGSSTSYYAGNIRYSTTTGTALQINANDFARYFKKIYSSGNLAYVTISGVPSTGSLYYNYYGTSQFGVADRTQLTAASVSGKVFSYSPSAKTEYALSELTYIPSGTNYCTALSFNAYGTNGQSAAGIILISVNAKAIPEVYSVATKGTSVTFPASSISAAVASVTGTNLSGIQLLDLPSTTSGVVYAGSAAAGTTTNYSYSSMSQLRFVPNSNFTGSVSIPYVALNSNGVAFAAGTFSIGVVSSVKKFSDVTTSTWCYKYVTELSGSNIISGYSNGSFQEKNTITYGAALKLIMLAAGYGEQAPTVKGSTFSGYLAKAKADGLVTGNPKLNGSITRLQIAQIASKALKLSTTNLSNKKPFTDTNDVYVQALNAAGIIEGYFSNGTSTYKPNNTLTRGQVSAIVWRMRNYGK